MCTAKAKNCSQNMTAETFSPGTTIISLSIYTDSDNLLEYSYSYMKEKNYGQKISK